MCMWRQAHPQEGRCEYILACMIWTLGSNLSCCVKSLGTAKIHSFDWKDGQLMETMQSNGWLLTHAGFPLWILPHMQLQSCMNRKPGLENIYSWLCPWAWRLSEKKVMQFCCFFTHHNVIKMETSWLLLILRLFVDQTGTRCQEPLFTW